MVKAEDIQFQFDKVAMDKLSAIADETKERIDAAARELAAGVNDYIYTRLGIRLPTITDSVIPLLESQDPYLKGKSNDARRYVGVA
jgi:hypothetical protein